MKVLAGCLLSVLLLLLMVGRYSRILVVVHCHVRRVVLLMHVVRLLLRLLLLLL